MSVLSLCSSAVAAGSVRGRLSVSRSGRARCAFVFPSPAAASCWDPEYGEVACVRRRGCVVVCCLWADEEL